MILLGVGIFLKIYELVNIKNCRWLIPENDQVLLTKVNIYIYI